jgi:hypothetical protein
MSGRVYLHVGLPKTGTTYVQTSLWESQRRLEANQILLPGGSRLAQRRAVYDLLGRRLGGDDNAEVPGSWSRLVKVAASTQDSAIISEELLVHARPKQARRIIGELAPADVHVVVTVRDLARALPSMWQYEVSHGATWSWDSFLAAVRDPAGGPPTAGVGFWLRYDLGRVLRLWQSVVPPERIHVVLVPGPDAPPDRLLERFAAAVDVPPDLLTPSSVGGNQSVGVVGTEVIRRLNIDLGDGLSERQRLRVVRVLRSALRGYSGTSELRIPEAHRAWLQDKSDALIADLKSSGSHIVGDVDDLRPDVSPRPDAIDPAVLTAETLLEASSAALAGLTVGYAKLGRRVQRSQGSETTAVPSRLRSSLRAFRFGVQSRVFDKADHNRLIALMVRRYYRRSSRATDVRR